MAATWIPVCAIPAAVMYFLMSWPLSIITRRIEVRMQLGKNP
jgi:ABC-type amino acid transport system permease subunit